MKSEYPRKPKRNVPKFGSRKHEVSHATARKYRKGYIEKYSRSPAALAPSVYGVNIFKKILRQKGCAGIRFYPGLDPKGQVTLLFCGVDRQGNDILEGTIGDIPWRCPPICSDANGILQF